MTTAPSAPAGAPRSPGKARFWTHENGGWIRIELSPGQNLAWSRCERTDEGWSGTSSTWDLSEDGLFITWTWCSEGRDCDGYLRRDGELVCHVEELAHEDCYGGDLDHAGCVIRTPNWQNERDVRVYDESARAMGY